MIQLLRFVKKPGLKTTFIQIASENMNFLTLDMKLIPIDSYDRRTRIDSNIIVGTGDIKLHLHSLFDENEILPIKNAHITVEIHAFYPDQTQT